MRLNLEIHIGVHPHNRAKAPSEFCSPCVLPTLPASPTPCLSNSNLFAAATGSFYVEEMHSMHSFVFGLFHLT